jgi:hypothetical protein
LVFTFNLTGKTKPMKTKKIHASVFGWFAPTHLEDEEGYIVFHDSPRYAKATDESLERWALRKNVIIRNAAEVEQRSRLMAEWQEENDLE